VVLLGAGSALHAGEAEVKILAEVEFFACGGIGFGGTTSAGETAFKKIYAEKNNLEQFVVVYGRGTNAARMYALVAFYKLNRPLYDHLKTHYEKSELEVTMMMGCDRYSQNVGSLISLLEKGSYESLSAVEAKNAR